VILPDSSAWIAFLRGSGSPAHLHLRSLVAEEGDVVVTEPVIMEVLAGARDAGHLRQLKRLLYEFPLASVAGIDDYETAASTYEHCRRLGTTPRNLVDCLIAAVALRIDATVLHQDRDFDAIARHLPLKTVTR
jgi:predicted nucleic acid-binding protein